VPAAEQKKLINHRIFDKGVDALMSRLTGLSPGPLIRVCGLTGTGKTEIAMAVARAIAGPIHLWPERTLPVAFTRATKSDRGRFSAKDFAHRAHSSVAEPDPTWAARTNEVGTESAIERRLQELRNSTLWKLLHSRSTEEGLRDGCVSLWTDYKVRFHFFDDVHAFAAVTGKVKPSDLVQAWICAAEQANVTLIFCGTSAMNSLWDGEGEIDRRSKTIFLPRYDLSLNCDRRDFVSMVLSIAGRFKWEDFDVKAHCEQIYYLSCGTFGQVLALFERSLDNARASKRSAITKGDFLAAIPNVDAVEQTIRRAKHYDLIARPAALEGLQQTYEKVMEAR